jgi:hypothetical protein
MLFITENFEVHEQDSAREFQNKMPLPHNISQMSLGHPKKPTEKFLDISDINTGIVTKEIDRDRENLILDDMHTVRGDITNVIVFSLN